MSENYEQLLVRATTATEKAESVKILTKILADKGGRDFISRLDRKNGESCIEILDHVSRYPQLVPLNLSWLPGSVRTHGQQYGEADVVRHLVDAGRNPQTTA